MQVKVFSFTPSSIGLRISSQEVEETIAKWLSEHSQIRVHTIQHSTTSNFWYAPQLIVSIYFE
jgi:hypothetical protein